MAVFNSGEGLILRIEKSLTNNPAIRWRNTYELYNGTGAQTSAQLTALVQAYAQAEASLHGNVVRFERATLSTWRAEPFYRAEDLLVVTFSDLFGGRTLPTEGVLDLRVALNVKRIVDFGRQGNLLYRGVLSESDTTSTAGSFILTPTATNTLNTILATFATATAAAAAASGLQVTLLSALENQILSIREVKGYAVNGVTVKKLNNRYFDKP